MRNPFRRRWAVRKYSKMTGRWIEEHPPAPRERLYWTKSQAFISAARLNWGMKLLRYDDRAEFIVVERKWKSMWDAVQGNSAR